MSCVFNRLLLTWWQRRTWMREDCILLLAPSGKSLSNWLSRWELSAHTRKNRCTLPCLSESGCMGAGETAKTFNFLKPMHYRSWSTPMSTTWRHFTRSHLTKTHMCARSPTALIMMSLPWTRTAGRRGAWLCSHANFNALDRETEWAPEGKGNYWHAISSQDVMSGCERGCV